MKCSIVLLFLSVAGACHSTPAETDHAILVTASVTPLSFRVGDAATVTVSVENRGTRAVPISLPACPAWFEVLKGEVIVAPGTQACAAYSLIRTLEPGTTYMQSFEWRGNTWPSPSAPTSLDPGSYMLRPAVRVASTMYRGSSVGVELTR